MSSKRNLQKTPNKYKEENELKGRNIGTVLVNNNKVSKNDFDLSSGKKKTRRPVKSGKVYNLSHEDRIFDISPYIAPNYVRDFKYEGGEQKKFRDSKKDSKRKSKKIDAKESDKKKILNEKSNELEEENIQKLKQLDEDEKQIQLEDEERQKELEEEGNKQKALLEDEDEDEDKQKEMNPNENQDKIIEDKLNEEKINEEEKKIQHSENQKKLEEDEKNKDLNEEKINLDELNILIKGTIKELFEPKNVDNIVYDKIIILMKCLSKENKEKFIDGLVQAIKTEEDEKRFAFILGEVSGNGRNEEKKQDILDNLKPYNEDEYHCHCNCHYGGECEE